eukprot:5226990-Pleurochrysis_carterae.AAC.1
MPALATLPSVVNTEPAIMFMRVTIDAVAHAALLAVHVAIDADDAIDCAFYAAIRRSSSLVQRSSGAFLRYVNLLCRARSRRERPLPATRIDTHSTSDEQPSTTPSPSGAKVDAAPPPTTSPPPATSARA